MTLPPNPKKIMGDKKPPLDLLPLAGLIHWSLAHLDGNLKYGFENWNDTPVEKRTYIGAIMRHTMLYKYGENLARDTTVHNLGAVMACCAILLDAELNGNLIDNTRHSKATCDLLHEAEKTVAVLKDMQKQREQDKISKEWAEAEIANPRTLVTRPAEDICMEAANKCGLGESFIPYIKNFQEDKSKRNPQRPTCGVLCPTPSSCADIGECRSAAPSEAH